MARLAVSLAYLVFFVLPQLTVTSTPCSSTRCSGGGPTIRFPFRLKNRQPPSCGYSGRFDLSCDIGQQTTLFLPSSSDFIVKSIDYLNQTLWINDPNWCIHKRFLDQDFSLAGTPFHFWNGLQNYTYFNCSSEVEAIGSSIPISCLTGNNYQVFVVPTSRSTTEKLPPPSLCRVISTALLPSASFLLGDDLYGVKLTWSVPDCSSCEASGLDCGINVTTLQIECFSSIHGGLPKYVIVIGVVLPAMMMIVICTGYSFYVSKRRRAAHHQDTLRRARLHELITQLPTVTNNGQPQDVITGLEKRTLESSNPKSTQLESLRLPDPSEKACSICLGEYQSWEELKIMPDCNHEFHVSCIDKWLSKNPTCPLCRNLTQRPEDLYSLY